MFTIYVESRSRVESSEKAGKMSASVDPVLADVELPSPHGQT